MYTWLISSTVLILIVVPPVVMLVDVDVVPDSICLEGFTE